MKRIAVIGAGLAGVTLGADLSNSAEIVVFEKSRGAGGRMATRYAPPFEFDHGAPFFSAKDARFVDAVRAWQSSGVVSDWTGAEENAALNTGSLMADETNFVAVPRMNQLCKNLVKSLDLQLSTEIASIAEDGHQWRLADKENNQFHGFDWVVMAMPSPQVSALAPTQFSGRDLLRHVEMEGCFTLMLGFDAPCKFDASQLDFTNTPISHIIKNSSKPERPAASSLVIHTKNTWAQTHIDRDKEQVQAELTALALDILGDAIPLPAHAVLHRWRYAATRIPADVDYLIDEKNRLAACGDWCRGSSVEDAYLSGARLADHLRTLIVANR